MTYIPERRVYEATMQMRDTQLVGKPYKYLEGRAVPYNVFADVGWYLEQHDAGSLVRTTKEAAKGLPLLLWHNNKTWPIGVSDSWDHQDDGLHGVWRLNSTNDAQQAAMLAESGDLGYLSIGFSPIQSRWEFVDDFNPELGPDHMDSVTRLESRLLEVSMTPTPAFATAEITLVRTAEQPRARSESKLDAWRRELEKLKR